MAETKKERLLREAKEIGLEVQPGTTIPQLEAAVKQAREDERPADAPKETATPSEVNAGQADVTTPVADAPGIDATDDGGATGVDRTSALPDGSLDDKIAQAQAELGPTPTEDPTPVESDAPSTGDQPRQPRPGVVDGTGGAMTADPPAVPPADGAADPVRPSSTTPVDVDGQTPHDIAEARQAANPLDAAAPVASPIGEVTTVDHGLPVTNGLSAHNAVTLAAPQALVADIDPRPAPVEPTLGTSSIPLIAKLNLDDFTEAQLTDVVAEVQRIRVNRRRAASRPTTKEVAVTIPEDRDASADYDLDRAARKVDVDPDSILSVSVRQVMNASGRRIGDKYLIVVTNDGEKHAARL